jgi:hypothetical protein
MKSSNNFKRFVPNLILLIIFFFIVSYLSKYKNLIIDNISLLQVIDLGLKSIYKIFF